jgi:hypothetical protein
MDEEEAAEYFFLDFFKNHLSPRAAALDMNHLPTILFEVLFPNESSHQFNAFYTQDDWLRSESIIFPDSKCKWGMISI